MELLQLRYFFESAKEGSFAKVASLYQVPATSVSASVRRLEKELGCELFDRTSNRILLNEKGKQLQASLSHVFKELEKAAKILKTQPQDTRPIRILVRCLRMDITNRIIEFREKNPGITFRLSLDFAECDFENYDIVIDESNERYAHLESFELCRTAIRLRAEHSFPLLGKKISLSDLKDHPFISIGEESGVNRLFVSACRKAGFTPNIVIQCNDIKCNETYVAAGVGIGVSREPRSALPPNRTAYLNVVDFHEMHSVYCYYKKNSAYGNVRSFLEFLRGKALQ